MEEIIENSKTKREKVINLEIFISTKFSKLPYYLDYSSAHDVTSLEGPDWTKEIVQKKMSLMKGHWTVLD